MSFWISIPDHLIGTKFYPPRVRDRLVRRRQLLDRLNENADYRLTLVSAAAGYGKSTLAHQWLRESEAPYAWLSLDEYDNKLDLFADYLITALGSVYPEMGIEAGSLLRRAQLPDAERLVDGLLRDLQDLPRPVFLVLDDFHVIKDQEIMAFMNRLLKRMPANLHLVLLARIDPPLALAPMRGRGQLLELRGHDLRFTTEEAAALLKQIVGEPIDSETVQLLTERTEGWPAGLRMAAMSLRASGDPREFTSKYSEGGHKLVSDYLLNEVLEHLPNEWRLIMLRAAVVDRFCAPLVDALAEGAIPGLTGFDFLEQLWSSNFFLIALDAQGVWYRFHHLFRQLLQQQLARIFSDEAIAGMHLRASYWFEEAGFIEEAILHALQGGDKSRGARLVETHVYELVNEENWRVVERWVDLLPEAMRRRPGILVVQAMLEQLRSRLAAMLLLLDDAQVALESGAYDYTPAQAQTVMGIINAFRAIVFIPSNSPQDMMRYARQAMKQIDPTAQYVLSVAELMYIYACQQAGETQEAIRLARKGLSGHIGPSDMRTRGLMLAQCAVYYAESNVSKLRDMSQIYLNLASPVNHLLSVGWANYFLGWCAYQENELDEAKRHFSRVVSIRNSAHMRAVVDSFIGLVLINYAEGDAAEAAETLQLLRAYLLAEGVMNMAPLVDSLALRGEVQVVPDVTPLGQEEVKFQLAADIWEPPILTVCRAVIAKGNDQSLAAVEEALAICRAYAESRNNKRQMMRIGNLQALVSAARGENERALDFLAGSVSLGQSGGALRIFVDCGFELVPYLVQLKARGIAQSYIGRILQAYPTAATPADAAAGDGGQVLSPEAAAVMAELTNREMDILQLLGEQLTNREIAARLHIAPSTVGKHAIKLYAKLGVIGRRQAVARARELGVLTKNSRFTAV